MLKAKVKTCHFIVEGVFLTNITRQLWADEGKPEKAFSILEAAFPTMTKADKFAILIGEKKLTGDSNKGCYLVKDATKHSTSNNLLSFDSVFGRFRETLEEQEDWLQLTRGTTYEIASPKGLISIPHRRKKAYIEGNISLNDFPHMKENGCISNEPRPAKVPLDSIEVATIPKKKPKFKRIIDNDHGWLSPDGKFYSCGYGEHILLGDQLGFEERELEEKQWMKIQQGSFWLPERQEMSQKQRDMIFDWFTSRKKSLPGWFNA